MDIKEAYDVIYEHLKEECNKQGDNEGLIDNPYWWFIYYI